MRENVYQDSEVLLDFNLSDKSYLVNAVLSFAGAPAENCAICRTKDYAQQKRTEGPPNRALRGVSIQRIKRMRLELPIELDSSEGKQVRQHIEEVLLTSGGKMAFCDDCLSLSLFWLLLDKK